MKLATALAAALLLAACTNPPEPAPTTNQAGVDPATVGAVTGTVMVEGTVPPAEVIRLDADPKCLALAEGEERRAESIVVGDDNTLQNVFVYVKDGLPGRLYPIPSETVVLDQQKCRYVPRVLGIQVGQALTIRNSDPLLHNVRSEGAINEPFDIGTPVQGVEVKRTFVTREVMVPFKCDVHAWMTAFVGVLDHPYFGTTGAEGRVVLANLPPGTYTIEAWHETLGAKTQQVTIGAKESRDVSFAFTYNLAR